MNITHKISMDLTRRLLQPPIQVMQDDQYSRELQFLLTANGEPWEIPAEFSAMIRWHRESDKAGGSYDALPDGSLAYSKEGNILTVQLLPQVCTNSGQVYLTVMLATGSAVAHTFTVVINVCKNPGSQESIPAPEPDVYQQILSQYSMMSARVNNLASSIGGGYATPQMFGAKGDGVTDDTASINEALRAHNNVYFPKGTYLVDGTYPWYDTPHKGGIVVTSNHHILMDKECIIQVKDNTTGFYNAFCVNGENVVIEGGKIVGDRQRHDTSNIYVQGYGIGFKGARNCVVRGVEISQMWADGMIIHDDSGDEVVEENSNITIENCIIHDCNRQGVSFIGGHHIAMRDCEIYNIAGKAPQSGIDIEPASEDAKYVHDVLFDNVHIHDTNMASIYYSKCYNITFANMRCDSNVEAVGKAYNIIHDKCFYSILDLRGKVYDVRVSNGTFDEIYLYEDPVVNLYNCIINGRNDSGVFTFLRAPMFTGKVALDGCKLVLTEDDNAQYRYLVWGAETTGSFSFVNCDVNIPEENPGTYLIHPKECEVEFRGCSIEYNTLSSQICTMPKKLFIVDSTLKSNATIGFLVPLECPFSFIVKNSIVEMPEYLAYMTSAEYAHDYNFIVENNLFTFVYDHINANIKTALTKAVDENNHVIVNV